MYVDGSKPIETHSSVVHIKIAGFLDIEWYWSMWTNVNYSYLSIYLGIYLPPAAAKRWDSADAAACAAKGAASRPRRPSQPGGS